MREIIIVAEAEESVVTIPVILEVAEAKVEVTVRVRIDIRHPVVAVGTPSAMYDVPSLPPKRAPAFLCILFRVLNNYFYS
jgi:hypothetical protein